MAIGRQSQNLAYRGRFAPSPSGPLHFGSLIAAVASWLAAKNAGGAWLVRIEDIDTPRVARGAIGSILATLEAHGLVWDEDIIYQSRRLERYGNALVRLKTGNFSYPCACTRKQISGSAVQGPLGPVYPGTCRRHAPAGSGPFVWRARLPSGATQFNDLYQGLQHYNFGKDIGDFVLQRRDGIFSYQLAVAVDDGSDGITHVVRGSDLLATSPGQIWLRKQLRLPQPRMGHVPVVVDHRGIKLSKQFGASPVDDEAAPRNLRLALEFLSFELPAGVRGAACPEMLEWAMSRWNPALIAGIESRPMPE